jgi:hypothetical protein
MVRIVITRAAVAVAVILLGPAAAPADPVPDQTDTFGPPAAALGWGQGHANGNITIPSGGPGGAGDLFFQVVSGGGAGAGGKMIYFNTDARWTGNYTTGGGTGVNAIDMDVRNLSATAMVLRIGLQNTGQGYISNNATSVPLAGNGAWTHVVFPINTASMNSIGSPTPLPQFLTSVGEVRILSSATGQSFNGDTIAATLGVDNIRARFIPVPEPAHSLALAAFAAGVVGWLRRRRKCITTL